MYARANNICERCSTHMRLQITSICGNASWGILKHLYEFEIAMRL